MAVTAMPLRRILQVPAVARTACSAAVVVATTRVTAARRIATSTRPATVSSTSGSASCSPSDKKIPQKIKKDFSPQARRRPSPKNRRYGKPPTKKGAVCVPAKIKTDDRLIKETDANKDYHVPLDADRRADGRTEPFLERTPGD